MNDPEKSAWAMLALSLLAGCAGSDGAILDLNMTEFVVTEKDSAFTVARVGRRLSNWSQLEVRSEPVDVQVSPPWDAGGAPLHIPAGRNVSLAEHGEIRIEKGQVLRVCSPIEEASALVKPIHRTTVPGKGTAAGSVSYEFERLPRCV